MSSAPFSSQSSCHHQRTVQSLLNTTELNQNDFFCVLFPAYFRRVSSSEVSCALGANVSSPLCASAAVNVKGSKLEGKMDSPPPAHVTGRKMSFMEALTMSGSERLKDTHHAVCRADDALHQKTLHVSAQYSKVQEETLFALCLMWGCWDTSLRKCTPLRLKPFKQ